MDSSPSPTSVKLSHSAVFPTPPAVTQQAMALPTEVDSIGVAIIRQIKQERDSDMAGIETRLEDAMMKRMDRMEQRLEEVARQGRKEQVVSQKMKRMLPSLVTRGMEGVERDMVTKLGGLENRLAKELVTSLLMEAIGHAMPKGVTEMVDSSYRQAFGQQAAGAGFERALGSMLQEVSEQFMSGSSE